MRKEMMLVVAIVLTFFVASTICLIGGVSADPSDSNADEITVTLNGESKYTVKTNGSISYLFDTSAVGSDSGIQFTGKGDTFQNYEIFAGDEYSGVKLEIYIPEGKTLYLMNSTTTNHYAVDFSDSLSSITITGAGELNVHNQTSTTIHQRYIGFNGVPTTINGITLPDEVLIFGGSIANNNPLDSTNLKIVDLTYRDNADGSAQIVAGSRFSDVGKTNLVIDNVDSTDVNVSVYGGSYNTFQLLTICGNVSETNVIINNGKFSAVYGGSFVSNTDPNDDEVKSSARCDRTSVTINGGTVDVLYGGSYDNNDDTFSTSTGDTRIFVKGTADVGNIYGGGHQSETDDTYIIMSGGSVSSIFGGSRFSGKTGNVTIEVYGGNVKNSIYGGNFANSSNGDSSENVNITLTGGVIGGFVYGGGRNCAVNDVNIDISGSVQFDQKYAYVYGGSLGSGGANSVNVSASNVKGEEIWCIFGGSAALDGNKGGDVETARIVVENSWIREIYGGGDNSDVDSASIILIEGTVIGNHVFGGGLRGDTGSTSIRIDDNVSVAHSVYGGGYYSKTTEALIEIHGGTIGRGVMAGGRDGSETGSSTVEKATINVYGGEIGYGDVKDLGIFAGGGSDDESGKAVDVSINVMGGRIYSITMSDANKTGEPLVPDNSLAEVTGGSFSTPIDESWVPNGYEYIIDSEGNVVVAEESSTTPSWSDDEDLPPFIPTQPAEDDDTVTIVACAAAAAVAAILAVFLVIDRKG